MLSKSSLNTFLTCPRLYKYLYIDKISVEITSPAAQRGIDVHKFCCDFYDYVTVTPEEFIIDKDWLEKELTSATEEALPYMKNFLKFEEERWKICKQHCPENPGKYFIPVLKEKKIVNWGLGMRGIVDRVDLNFDDKTYTVVDYKTETYSEKMWKRTEHRREMAFYKVLLESSGLIEGEVTHFCIYYPKSNDVWVEPFNKRTLNALDRAIEKVRNKIASKDFPVKVGAFCRWCSMNTICDFGEEE